jgi:hypothetical protein
LVALAAALTQKSLHFVVPILGSSSATSNSTQIVQGVMIQTMEIAA